MLQSTDRKLAATARAFVVYDRATGKSCTSITRWTSGRGCRRARRPRSALGGWQGAEPDRMRRLWKLIPPRCVIANRCASMSDPARSCASRCPRCAERRPQALAISLCARIESQSGRLHCGRSDHACRRTRTAAPIGVTVTPPDGQLHRIFSYR